MADEKNGAISEVWSGMADEKSGAISENWADKEDAVSEV